MPKNYLFAMRYDEHTIHVLRRCLYLYLEVAALLFEFGNKLLSELVNLVVIKICSDAEHN